MGCNDLQYLSQWLHLLLLVYAKSASTNFRKSNSNLRNVLLQTTVMMHPTSSQTQSRRPIMFIVSCLLASFKSKKDTKNVSYRQGEGQQQHLRSQMTNSQLVLVCYTIFVHVLGLGFPIRSCWAVKNMTTDMKRPQIQAAAVRKPMTRTHLRYLESESGYEDSIFSKCSEFEVEVSAESEYEDGYLCTPLSCQTLTIRGSPLMMKRRDTLFLRMIGRPLFWTIDCVTYWNLLGNDPYVSDPVEVRVGTVQMRQSWPSMA